MRASVRVVGAGGISGIGVGDRATSGVVSLLNFGGRREGSKLGHMSGDISRGVGRTNRAALPLTSPGSNFFLFKSAATLVMKTS
jgi:hypothetical protein